MTGRLEEVSYQLRKLDDRLNKVTSDMEYRLSQIKAGAASGAPRRNPHRAAHRQPEHVAARWRRSRKRTPRLRSKSSPPDRAFDRPRSRAAAAGSPASSQTASLPPKTPREQYARAFSLLEKRNYEEAGAGFSEFLKVESQRPAGRQCAILARRDILRPRGVRSFGGDLPGRLREEQDWTESAGHAVEAGPVAGRRSTRRRKHVPVSAS